MEWIFDRTQEDVDRAIYLNQKYMSGTITDEEKAEWQSDSKGTLNASDLNRIEGNIAELANDIAKEVLSFDLKSIVAKQWSGTDLPRVSDFLRIRNNVQAIRDAWYTTGSTPDTPEPPLNYFEKINDIERILHDLYETYLATISHYDYCGEFYAGEEVAYI